MSNFPGLNNPGKLPAKPEASPPPKRPPITGGAITGDGTDSTDNNAGDGVGGPDPDTDKNAIIHED
jgi:hypothetical protein